ncbi:MAG: hypothetical protein ABIG44_13505 [Planctomycetota bacterium]
MLPVSVIHKMFVAALLALASQTAALRAESAEDRFYHAYYLEHASGDVAGAAELYAQVAKARQVDAEIKREAQNRLAACREELATDDFAKLMPPNTLAYVELNRPGQRLRGFIDELGLLSHPDDPPRAGENRLAISPAILDAVLGMRGIAAAVTGFDPAAARPSGVVVFHPGDMELVRGLIETALPIQCALVEPIAGYPTYDVEGEVFVTLTARLVVAGTHRGEIEGVIDRMRSPGEDSLATNPDLAEVLADRQDALLFFCVNPKPLMPLLHGLLAAGATQNHELAIAQALVDLDSLQSLSGRFDLSGHGLLAELTLRLDEGHRNLVYNLMRGPAIDRESLRCVPQGAAGFLALALNDAPADYADPSSPPGGDPIVTALDFGRELFANINGIAVYALPPDGTEKTGKYPILHVAASLTVNDPARSRALWTELFGIASIASGGGVSLDGMPFEIEGVTVHRYHFEDDVTVFFAIDDHHLLISSTETAMASSLRASHGGQSVLDDQKFTKPLSCLGPHATLAILGHPARCAQIAKQFMSEDEVAEMEPFLAPMTDTVVCVAVNHSDRMLRISAALTGLPDVGTLVSDLLTAEQRRGRAQRQLSQAMHKADWRESGKVLEGLLAEKPTDRKLLCTKFDMLAVQKKDQAAAREFAGELLERWAEDANALNNFAWSLLTEDKYGGKYNEVALRFARHCDELSHSLSWAYVDTLARAEFETGNVAEAIRLQEKAIKLCKQASGDADPAIVQTLARYQAAGGQE